MNKIYELASRKEIPLYTKMKPKPEEGRHLIKYKNEKDYDYYICDYCNKEIKILNKKQEMTGGIIELSHLVTKKNNIKLVLHNKCLKPVLKMIEEE